jgi:hypothetical protein
MTFTGDTEMLTSKPSVSTKAMTKLGLAAMVAVLWMTSVPAVARTGYQISGARAAAIHECSILADRYSEHDWGITEVYQYRACMAGHGENE